MTKWESVPDPVFLAAAAIVGGQLGRFVDTSFQPTEWVGVGIAVIAVLLLIGGTRAGWIVAAFWAASAVSGPFVFGSAVWIGVVGLVVGLALCTKEARGYCFKDSSGTLVSRANKSADQPHTSAIAPHVPDAAVGRGGYWRYLHRRLTAVRISRKVAFFGFLIGTLVLLPATGLLGRLDRGSGRGNVLVDISYHMVVIAETVTQIGLLVMLVLIVRATVR
ncbi:MAG TPA: hypothetical protein VHZ54_18560 [Solirubrobacterales bacterium]|jgi:hypothetical protein|nr:hypothetical protein [Solirubrobacterales bacterium]